ncbi:glucan biosynthesis protein [Oecophyllibacter saccharovorans]|uniref:Glucan biosynthesis protein G n=1 Tax=Oecophyllibacter saccharovorans TaxID=2558360 RepID=A0A506ULC6_9PROT|nr:glucan biosynthesis protein G [Oecophyllibacter saccharovorans]TPW34052.1 glucan biosynthesis protein G [Oecophyllibacter saccharovorans]
MDIRRRDLVRASMGTGLSLSVLGLASRQARAGEPQPSSQAPAQEEPETDSQPDPASTPFDSTTVSELARALSRRPYKAPPHGLPAVLADMSFDQFNSIIYDPAKALWAGDHLNFDVEFFPRGYLYKPRVNMYEVQDGRATLIPYSPDLFQYRNPKLKVDKDIGFSGLRLRYAFDPGHLQECAVFLGASYFRATARGQVYGLSARGFAKDTGTLKGEEFPLFRAFWLEKPAADSHALVMYGLLDSPSLTGAFRFTIRPGDTTLFDVQSVFYPRVDIAGAGIAPLTGMYFFDFNDHDHVDDWRPAAHDSEALQMWTGAGQQLYRPLTNPTDLQLGAFVDSGPYGFGLMQRRRAFHDYEDLVLKYEKRPSLWIEPVGNWGDGTVNLVEIPTPSEVNDNIVAFWRPKETLKANQAYRYTYRMYWGWDTPWPTHLARVAATRVGNVVDHPELRQFVIDFTGAPFRTLPPNTPYHLIIHTTPGEIRKITLLPNPHIHGMRAMFQLAPGDAKLCEMQAQLATDKGPISETWLYRWTP